MLHCKIMGETVMTDSAFLVEGWMQDASLVRETCAVDWQSEPEESRFSALVWF